MIIEGNMLVVANDEIYKVVSYNTTTGICYLRSLTRGSCRDFMIKNIRPYFIQIGDKVRVSFANQNKTRTVKLIKIIDVDMFFGYLSINYRLWDKQGATYMKVVDFEKNFVTTYYHEN